MDDDSIKTSSEGEKGREVNMSNISEDYENIPSLTELEGEILFDNSEDMIELIDITDSPEEDETQMEIPSQQSNDENQSTPVALTEEVVVTSSITNEVSTSKSLDAAINLYDILALEPANHREIMKTTQALEASKPEVENNNILSSTVTCSGANVIWPEIQKTPANNDFRRHDLTEAQLKNILTFCPVCRERHESHHEVSQCLFENNKKLCWLCLDVINSKAVEEYYWHCVKNHLISSGLFVDCPYCVLSFDYRQGINYHIVTEHFNESPAAFFDFFNGQVVQISSASSELLMLLRSSGQVGTLWSENEERLTFQHHKHDLMRSETAFSEEYGIVQYNHNCPLPGEKESNTSKFTLLQAPTISQREREVESPFLLHSLKKPPGYMSKGKEIFQRDTAQFDDDDNKKNNKNPNIHNFTQLEEIKFNDKLFPPSEPHIFPVNTEASITTLTTSSPLYRVCAQEQVAEKEIEIDTHFDDIELSDFIVGKHQLTTKIKDTHQVPSDYVSCVIQSSSANGRNQVYLSNAEQDYDYTCQHGEIETGNQNASACPGREVRHAQELPASQLSPAIIVSTLGSRAKTTENLIEFGNNEIKSNQIVSSSHANNIAIQSQSGTSPQAEDKEVGESQIHTEFCSQTTQTQTRRRPFHRKNIRSKRKIRTTTADKSRKIPYLFTGITPEKGSQSGQNPSRNSNSNEVSSSSHAVVRNMYAGVLSLSGRQGLPEKICRSNKTNGEGNFISSILKLVGDDFGEKDFNSKDAENIADDETGGVRENTIQNSNSKIKACPRQTEALKENSCEDTRKIQIMEADTTCFETTDEGDQTAIVSLESIASTNRDASDKLGETEIESDDTGQEEVVNENNLDPSPIAPVSGQEKDCKKNYDTRSMIPITSDVQETTTEEIPEKGIQSKDIPNQVNSDILDRIELEMAAIHEEVPTKTETTEQREKKPEIDLQESLIKALEFKANQPAANSTVHMTKAEQDPAKMEKVRQNDEPKIRFSKTMDMSDNKINPLTNEHSNPFEDLNFSPKNADPNLKMTTNNLSSNCADKQITQPGHVSVETSTTNTSDESDIYDTFRNLEKECREIQLKQQKQKKLRLQLVNAQTQQHVQITQPNTLNQVTHSTKNNESTLSENAYDQSFRCSISKQGHLQCQRESDNVSGHSTNVVNTTTAAVVGEEEESSQDIASKCNLTRDSAQVGNTGSFQNVSYPVTEFDHVTRRNSIHGVNTNGPEQTSNLPSRKHPLQFSEIKRCLLNSSTHFEQQHTYNHSQEYRKLPESQNIVRNENEMRESQSDCREKTVQMVQENPIHGTTSANSPPTQYSSIHSANFTRPSTNFRYLVPTPTHQQTREVILTNACHHNEQAPHYPPNIPCQKSNTYGENKSSSNISPTEFSTGMNASNSFLNSNSPTVAKFSDDMRMEVLKKATEQNGRNREWIFDDPVVLEDIETNIESRRIEATSQNTNFAELSTMVTTSTTTTPWNFPTTPSSSWRANTNVTETHRQVCMNTSQGQGTSAGITRGHLQGNPICQERNPRCIKPQVNSGAVPNLPESFQMNCASAIHSGNSSKFEQFGSSLHVANSYADACKMPQSSGGVMRFDDFQNRDHPSHYPYVPGNLPSANSSGQIDLAIRPILFNRLRERHMMPMIGPRCQRHEQPQRPTDNQHEFNSNILHGDIGHNNSNYSSSSYSYHRAPEPMPPQNYVPYQYRQAPPYPRRHTVEWRANGRQNNMEDTLHHLPPRIPNSHFQFGHHSMQQLHSFNQQQFPTVQQQNMQFPGRCGMSMQQVQQNRVCFRQQYYQQLQQRQQQHLQHHCSSGWGIPPISIAPQYAEQCHRMMHQLHHNSINHNHRRTY